MRRVLAVYRWLVVHYPRSFEPEYREGITREAAALLEGAFETGGRLAVLRLCPALFRDVIKGLLASRVRDLADAVLTGRSLGQVDWWSQLRHAARTLLASRTTTALVLVVIALAIAVQAVVVATVDGVLLRPLPYEHSERLVSLQEIATHGSPHPVGVAPANFLDLEARARHFSAMTASTTSSMVATVAGAPLAIHVTRVTPGYFEVFARAPLAGRVLGRDDFDGAVWELNKGFLGPSASGLVSRPLADRLYGSARAAVGRTVRIEGRDWRIVGVMDDAFREATGPGDVWLPWLMRESYQRELPDAPRTWRFLDVAARLRPDVTLDEARAEAGMLASQLQTEHPVDNHGWVFRVTPASDLLVESFRPTLVALTLGVQIVLVLAAANVASLWLSRNLARQKQFAIRRLLGASRGRILGEIWLECAMLVGAGTALGLLGGHLLLPVVVSLLPEGTPRVTNIVMGGRTIGLVSAGALALAGLLSVVAAVQVSSGKSAGRLRELPANVIGTQDASGRLLMVGFQVALALLAITGGALTLQSLVALRGAHLGFTSAQVSVTRVALDRVRYDSARTNAFYARLLGELRERPEITAAAAVTALPLSDVGADFTRPYWRDGAKPETAPEARITMVTPGYFDTMGVPLMAGRDFNAGDGAAAPRVVIVNHTLSERVWPGRPAIEQRLTLSYRGGEYSYQVVGVARDTLHDGPRAAAVPEIFIPHAQNAYTLMNVVVKSTLAASDVSSIVATAMARIDPGQAVQSATTMEQLQARDVANERLATLLFVAMSALALIIATVGLYGVMSGMVSQRTREIALRMALGAPAPAITTLFAKSAIVVVAGGCAAGVLGALATGHQIAPLLFGVTASDGRTLAGALTLVLIISVVAIAVPVRRALRIDPAGVLRAY